METQTLYTGLSASGKAALPLHMANRHGLIAGASGTGKTVTMKVLAEGFSDAGVPCFICDIKGDVSGLAAAGKDSEDMQARIEKFGLEDFQFTGCPVTFWDVYQEKGHPVRISVSDMGPDLLSRLLQLSAAQDGVLHILFQIADDKGLLLHDLKDLKALLDHVRENRADYASAYGAISPQSLQAIQRAILPLEQQGGDLFFGQPALDIQDWIQTKDGKGVIQLLDCTKLYLNPLLYAAFLLWLLSELFEVLPEVGDLDKPKMVLFFDEAHLLFKDAPKSLVSKIEQVIRLIRSKGVGVYFISQSVSDLPATVLSQLSNRIQHGLRAYTPAEQKALKATAQSFRANPDLDIMNALQQLGTGQALVSFLDENGVPEMVRQVDIIPPHSSFKPVDDTLRTSLMKEDGMAAKYDTTTDLYSASEKLSEEKARQDEIKALEEEKARLAAEKEAFEKQKAKEAEAAARKKEKEEEAARKKLEKELEAQKKKEEREKERKAQQKEREAQKRKERVERELFNTGASLLKRTLLNTLKKK